jgi:hypothetical protein
MRDIRAALKQSYQLPDIPGCFRALDGDVCGDSSSLTEHVTFLETVRRRRLRPIAALS